MCRPSEDQKSPRTALQPIDSRNKGWPQREPFICNRDESDGPRNLVTTVVPHFLNFVVYFWNLDYPHLFHFRSTVSRLDCFFVSYVSKRCSNLCHRVYARDGKRGIKRERERRKDTRNQCNTDAGIRSIWGMVRFVLLFQWKRGDFRIRAVKFRGMQIGKTPRAENKLPCFEPKQTRTSLPDSFRRVPRAGYPPRR